MEEGKDKEKRQAGERMKQSTLPHAASRIWNQLGGSKQGIVHAFALLQVHAACLASNTPITHFDHPTQNEVLTTNALSHLCSILCL
jgi:ABC-type cobalamin/Fe3+-siderophores transport system ATPase subunit